MSEFDERDVGSGGGGDPDEAETLLPLSGTGGAKDSARAGSSSASSSSRTAGGSERAARLASGVVIAGRYRVVSFLGRGGMGEVYRAEDLKLGEEVALKLLPAELAADPARLARFHAEVRLARQVSHRHVCRVHDIGEVAAGDAGAGLARPFLTMEYVDGEDLAGLLRRIGRLPRDKAVEIARQVCAGLAAAHAAGVLHRDLKPANIMLDGRGEARIADFGLAGVAEEIAAHEVGAGTPAYMAPEQLRGESVSARSDIYSLGLVLYELFTGKRAFEGAATAAELRRMHETSAPATPSSVMGEMDPVVERVIMRCLERDPADRPASALAVAAALPGGDPLAAALAAGETPSPEMVAASGGAGVMHAGAALACVAVAAVLAVVYVALNPVVKWWAMAPAEKAPEVLVERAREILRDAGHEGSARFEYTGIESDSALVWHVRWRVAAEERAKWFRRARPALMRFYWRGAESPLSLEGTDVMILPPTSDWPRMVAPGEKVVTLDLAGRLRSMRVVEGFRRDASDEVGAAGEAEAYDWGALFAQAGLEMERFEAAPARVRLPAAVDEHRAWSGVLPDAPEVGVTVEAAARAGRAVYFRVWNEMELGGVAAVEEATGREADRRASERLGEALRSGQFLFIVGVAVVALVMARRNVRLGRGDRAAAMRLGLATLALFLAAALLTRPLSPWRFLAEAPAIVGPILFIAAITWAMYLAIEPLLRRLWPQSLTAWARLISGRWRDPLVGRSALIGLAAGALAAMIGQAANYGAMRKTGVAIDAGRAALEGWVTARRSFAYMAAAPIEAVVETFVLLIALAGLRALLKSPWLWAPAFIAVATLFSYGGATPEIALPAAAAVSALLLVVFVRVGALAAVAFALMRGTLTTAPLLPEVDTWRGEATIFWAVALGAALVYGFAAARGKRAGK